MATNEEKRAAKARKTKATNKAKVELQAIQLRKAQSTARNATRALKEYKKGMKDGIDLVTNAMRAS